MQRSSTPAQAWEECASEEGRDTRSQRRCTSTDRQAVHVPDRQEWEQLLYLAEHLLYI
jgi:hypothetical protein